MKIRVKVKPNSRVQKIEQNAHGVWVINVKSAPINGEANHELIGVIAKQFAVKKSQIIIKSGLSNQYKIIEVISC